ncbi:ATP-binding protein [Candidatus Saccharibacteria bacterium]|nr:ATP-binding protein [Candidatus Saccharibacteria bacterium]
MAENNVEYRPRIVDDIIRQKLKSAGALLIEGPKWCGKTTTAEQVAKSELKLGDPEELKKSQLVAISGINSLLDGDTPRLIDEWQTIPRLWDAVRSEVDRRSGFGEFILTGSAVPPDDEDIQHSGVGRFSRLRMRTMSLYESGDSNGSVSLQDLFDGKPIKGESDLTINDIAYLCARGGFPNSLRIEDKEAALSVARDYVDGIINSDLSRVDGIKRDPGYIARIMRSYARFQGEQAPITGIVGDIAAIEGNAPSINTVVDYCNALKKIFVIDDIAAWNPNLRSKTAIRTSDTRYFVDPSIAVAALETNPEGLMNDLKTFGFIFETMCMRDLRAYVESTGGNVSHYHDSNDLECDAVVHLYGGAYGFVQMKLGGSQEDIDQAAEKMNDLESRLDERQPKPAFHMVLTGANNVAYQREDGLYVVPIGCLRP